MSYRGNNDGRDSRIRQEQQERLLENETDSLANSLADKVSQIKQVTLQMQGNLNDDHVVIDNMGTSFDSVSSDIKRTSQKLFLVMQTPHGKRMGMIVGGIVMFFLLVMFMRS